MGGTSWPFSQGEENIVLKIGVRHTDRIGMRLSACAHVCGGHRCECLYSWRPEEGTRSLELELQMVVSIKGVGN